MTPQPELEPFSELNFCGRQAQAARSSPTDRSVMAPASPAAAEEPTQAAAAEQTAASMHGVPQAAAEEDQQPPSPLSSTDAAAKACEDDGYCGSDVVDDLKAAIHVAAAGDAATADAPASQHGRVAEEAAYLKWHAARSYSVRPHHKAAVLLDITEMRTQPWGPRRTRSATVG